MDNATRTLLTHLWRGGAWAYWWTPDGPENWSKKYQEMRREKPSLWYPLNQRWPEVPVLWRRRNVYFGVHPTQRAGARWQRARIATIVAVNCVFAEFDVKDYGSKATIGAHLDTLPLYPTCIIDSGGGLHAYWCIEDTQRVTDDNRSFYRTLQTAWVDLVGGDDGAKDLARVLRLPGFLNRKPQYAPDFPTVSIVEHTPRRVFPFADIAELVDDRVAAIKEAERRRMAEDAARSGEAAPGAAGALLEWAVRNAQTGSRHDIARWLSGKLKAEGIAQFAADSILKEFARRVNTDRAHPFDEAEAAVIVEWDWGRA